MSAIEWPEGQKAEELAVKDLAQHRSIGRDKNCSGKNASVRKWSPAN